MLHHTTCHVCVTQGPRAVHVACCATRTDHPTPRSPDESRLGQLPPAWQLGGAGTRILCSPSTIASGALQKQQSSMRGWFALALLVVGIVAGPARAFYVPGTYPQEWLVGDQLQGLRSSGRGEGSLALGPGWPSNPARWPRRPYVLLCAACASVRAAPAFCWHPQPNATLRAVQHKSTP